MLSLPSTSQIPPHLHGKRPSKGGRCPTARPSEVPRLVLRRHPFVHRHVAGVAQRSNHRERLNKYKNSGQQAPFEYSLPKGICSQGNCQARKRQLTRRGT